ncbi:hypothetical protein IP86_02870 [Rhodopseudomonas sp. AAP120]|uniref:hypothetical protein n=1 Tax=Rhodopseudomonas TaxID=1073 RepID=UPI000164A8C1|nr:MULTISPECIES: hypothetical protein [Rhodopseudomonas]KPG01771.1 hypothetical protein IP86_02870 [Rhodopseudomonas sp. AAP120]
MTTKSTPGRDRTAAYRARLAASREPPAYVVANAIMMTVAATLGTLPISYPVNIGSLVVFAGQR